MSKDAPAAIATFIMSFSEAMGAVLAGNVPFHESR
jgi:hypothetical protein